MKRLPRLKLLSRYTKFESSVKEEEKQANMLPEFKKYRDGWDIGNKRYWIWRHTRPAIVNSHLQGTGLWLLESSKHSQNGKMVTWLDKGSYRHVMEDLKCQILNFWLSQNTNTFQKLVKCIHIFQVVFPSFGCLSKPES
ncbi:hypothetical protein ACET3Z_000761 [Daucus carota]